jgi:general secretion pathway protein D
VAALTQPAAAQTQAAPPQPVAEEAQAAVQAPGKGATVAAAAKQQPEATAPAEAPPPPPAEPPPAGPQVLLTPASVKVGANALVGLQLEVKDAKDLFAAPVRIKYDPEMLEFKDAVQGDLLNRDGKQVVFARQTPRGSAGVAQIQLNRVPGAGGIDGSGTLLTLTFQARKGGTSQVTVESLTLRDTKLQPILTASPVATVVVE